MENPSQSYFFLDRLALVLGLGVVAFFCYQLCLWAPDRVMEVDTQGYFYLAQDLANLELPDRPDDLLRYRYHIYVDLPGDRVVAKYTPGFPLLLALGYTLGGTYGPFWVGPILSMGGALMFWALARALHGNLAALACTACWLGAPMMLTYSAYPLAHGSNIALVIGTFYFCLCWIRTGKRGFALATGFLAGFLPMVRGTNVFFYGALVLMLYFSKRIHADARPLRPHLTGALAAAAVPLAFFMVYNTLLFGAPWTTGYAFTREQNGFAWADFFLRLPTFFEQRGILFSDPVWIAAIFGLERGFRKQPALAGVLLAWFLPVVYVYGCYYWFGDRMGGAYYRFFLAAMPGLVLGLGFLFSHIPRTFWWHLILLVGLVGFVIWYPPSRALQMARGTFQSYSADWSRTWDPHFKNTDILYSEFHANTWAPSIFPHLAMYPLKPWADRHFLQAYHQECTKRSPRADLARHKRLHALYAEIKETGQAEHFQEHIRENIHKGRRVKVMVSSLLQEPLIWLQKSEDLQVREMERYKWKWRREKEENTVVLLEVFLKPEP